MNNGDITSHYYRANLYNGIGLAYLDCEADTSTNIKPRGTVLLIHGFPETSYQWRAVIPTLTASGHRVLAPDYRGAGESSKSTNDEGFTKASMAADMIMLLDSKGVDEKVHVVGHDIGGVIAFNPIVSVAGTCRLALY
ncbi:hypothetical protein KC353_g216 [Hortaea werneckii]|nr:hypothetical protein KC361_g8338 [Hortaea werneckii]KAI7722766.1 hypothetical protein KC353_g216 [Hortaea werneckii]